MEEFIIAFITNLPVLVLFVIILVLLYVLGKGADLLVNEAVTLSAKWGVPKVLIGATIVSLGTTLPEASVSVMAAFRGDPGLALGNAVGSIICDTGLIIGVAALISPLALNKRLVNRPGWLQFGAGILLVVIAVLAGSSIPQFAGFIFIALLAAYMIITVRWSRNSEEPDSENEENTETGGIVIVLIKLAAGVALIIISSKVLIPTVGITALRIGIPDSIIAATLVAFGTSLPELVTAISAAKNGHGDLAIGNVIGADILNVLFVVGASASVTKAGLPIPVYFFTMQFPVMIGILLTFRLITLFTREKVRRWHGMLLLLMYIGYTVFSYVTV